VITTDGLKNFSFVKRSSQRSVAAHTDDGAKATLEAPRPAATSVTPIDVDITDGATGPENIATFAKSTAVMIFFITDPKITI
jgi:hypothetical protein